MQRLHPLAIVLVGGFALGAHASTAHADKLSDPNAGSGSDSTGSADDTNGAIPKLIPSSGTGGSSSPPEDLRDIRSHKGQIGISARLALIGLSAIKPYSSSDYCGATSGDGTGNAALCLNRLPIAIDLEPSYGVSRHMELVADLRIGIEADFGATATANNGPHALQLAPGIRYFFSEGHRSKLFTTVQAVFDFTNYQNPSGTSRGNDFGARNLNGLWIDLDRAYGFYFFVGETATFARWLRLDLEAGVGLQVRFL
jgi:hypothetical protein